MNVKNTIFGSDNEEYNKVWENKEWFPLLNKEFTKVKKAVRETGVKRVVAFDQISPDWKDWTCSKEVTLCVLPICNVVDQGGSTTKGLLRSNGFTAKEKYMAIDIQTSEQHKKKGYVVYFPTRNLVISLVNPFFDLPLFERVMVSIKQLNPKIMSKEEIWKYLLEKEWRVGFERRFSDAEGIIKRGERDAGSYRSQYIQCCEEVAWRKREIKKLTEIRDNIGDYLKEQLDQIQKYPVIKKITVRDKIYVSFGTIYCTGLVKVGIKKVDGTEVPDMKPKKVEIGEMEFIIGSGEIKVTNKNKVEGLAHPHADENGKICWGDADADAQKLIANFEIAKLIKLLYSWAFSYNDGDAHLSLQSFYEARKDDS